jgi:uncharacterized protein YndB with AHSA1/START domain/pimeloyl-ACP methyl ester carboxylesterase
MENKKNDTSDRELRIWRVLDAPVELVWEVWTNPEHIAQWWGPNGFTNTIELMEVKPEGEWKLVMHGPDGTDYKNRSVFREVVPLKRIVYEHISSPKFVSKVEFEAQGERTLIRWHMLFETTDQLVQVVKTFKADVGLKQNIEKLGQYIGRFGKGKVVSGYAPVNGLQMYYEIHGGGGMPLVLMHGGGSTIESSFGHLLPLLARHRRIIAVEMQAHGRTNDRDGPESFQQDADDVAGLLGWLGVAKADILGFSNGGSTTLKIAIRHPALVNRIVAVSGAYRRDGFVAGFFEGFPNATLDVMPACLHEAYLKVAPDKSKLGVMFEKDKARMVGFEDWSDEELGGIRAPAMIVSSDRDVVTVEHAARMARVIPGAWLVILPGVHGSAIGTIEAGVGKGYAEVVAGLVEEFLGT